MWRSQDQQMWKAHHRVLLLQKYRGSATNVDSPPRILKSVDVDSLTYLRECNGAVVYGKGPTFRSLSEEEIGPNQFVVCVNNSVNECERCDMLVVNDVETWEKIQDEKLQKVKYVLTPVYPHKDLRPQKQEANMATTLNVLTQKGYAHDVIFYNLRTARENLPDYIRLDSAISGSNTAVDFIMKYIKNVKVLRTIGIGINGGAGYHNSFSREKQGQYNTGYIQNIRDHIQKASESIKYVPE